MLNNLQIRDALEGLGHQPTSIKKYSFEYKVEDTYFYLKRDDDRVIESCPLVIHPGNVEKRVALDSLEGVSVSWEPRKSTAYSKFPKLNDTESPYGFDLNVRTSAALAPLIAILTDSSGVQEPPPMPPTEPPITNLVGQPLNQILYGPPGTGKTYHTIDKALSICDPDFLTTNIHDREALKQRFDELVGEARIHFVTFHQSFSYEEFVQGIRASTENGQVRYSVEPGIFKQVCDIARDCSSTRPTDFLEVGDSFNGCDLVDLTKELAVFNKRNGKRLPMPREVIDTIAQLTRDNNFDVANTDGDELDRLGTAIEPYFVTGYGTIHRNIVQTLLERMPLGNPPKLPHVLIIDEINRGNIAKIFGELITLIEPSKRLGAAEELQVQLPYSSETDPLFGVPDNLFVIGTMNTADRSLALLDTALRRRFDFVEMAPDASVLDGYVVSEQGIDIELSQLLTTMNSRIEALYDREHCLGHAYLISVKDAIDQGRTGFDELRTAFQQRIIPLLEEYFYEDWSKIRLVLGDNQKADQSIQFVTSNVVLSDGLFGEIDDDMYYDIDLSRFDLQESAFLIPSAYSAVYE